MNAVAVNAAADRICPFRSLRMGPDVGCEGPRCMAWRWVEPPVEGVSDGLATGYCGACNVDHSEALVTHVNALTRAVLDVRGELRVLGHFGTRGVRR